VNPLRRWAEGVHFPAQIPIPPATNAQTSLCRRLAPQADGSATASCVMTERQKAIVDPSARRRQTP
jgi:hypothetical protein